MKKSMMGMLAVAAMATSSFTGLSFYPTGIRARKASRASIAQLNRWTGKPHEHKKAIARNLRQQKAIAQKKAG